MKHKFSRRSGCYWRLWSSYLGHFFSLLRIWQQPAKTTVPAIPTVFVERRRKRRRRRMFIFYPMQRLFENDAWYLYELNLMSCSATQLALRLVAVIKFDVRSYSTLFFTCKNGIILFLQFYRLVAILTENDSYDLGSLYQTTTTIPKEEQALRKNNHSLRIRDGFDSKLSIRDDTSLSVS